LQAAATVRSPLAFTIDLKALYEFFRDRPQENAPLGMKT
jgi:hypothetical protein